MVCKNNPLVSIIIAAHNEGNYLDQCIKSCIEQTYQNIEICITDDGSTDNTLDLLKKHRELDNRIKICHHKRNLGVVAAFNSAFNLASGDYIAISCADDINDKRRISKSLELLVSSKSDILSSCMLKFNNSEEILGISGFHHNPDNYFSLLNIFKNHSFLGGTLFFTREVGHSIYPIPENLHCTDGWISALTFSHEWKHIHSNFISAYYRFHDQNDVATPSMKFPDYKNRLIRTFHRRDIFHSTYLDHIKTKQLMPSEEILSYLKDMKEIDNVIINPQTHSKARCILNLLKVFSNTKDWYGVLLVTLNLSYLLYLRRQIIDFIEKLIIKKIDNKRFHQIAGAEPLRKFLG